MMCLPWMLETQVLVAWNLAWQTMLLVLVSAHRVTYQVCTHDEVHSDSHIRVAVSYRPLLPEHHEETHSSHLVALDSNLMKLKWLRQV
jgi:hypothetical protein